MDGPRRRPNEARACRASMTPRTTPHSRRTSLRGPRSRARVARCRALRGTPPAPLQTRVLRFGGGSFVIATSPSAASKGRRRRARTGRATSARTTTRPQPHEQPDRRVDPHHRELRQQPRFIVRLDDRTRRARRRARTHFRRHPRSDDMPMREAERRNRRRSARSPRPAAQRAPLVERDNASAMCTAAARVQQQRARNAAPGTHRDAQHRFSRIERDEPEGMIDQVRRDVAEQDEAGRETQPAAEEAAGGARVRRHLCSAIRRGMPRAARALARTGGSMERVKGIEPSS